MKLPPEVLALATKMYQEQTFGVCQYQHSDKCKGTYKRVDTPTDWCGRCNPCEKEHEVWRENLVSRSSQGEWSRQAEGEKNAHAKDILQPLKKDGTINKDFVAVHGTKALEKELKTSKAEIMYSVEKYG